MTVMPRLLRLIRAKIIKTGLSVLKEEKICYKMVYYTSCLGPFNCQKSRWKDSIYVDEKPTFLKRAWQGLKAVKYTNQIKRMALR